MSADLLLQASAKVRETADIPYCSGVWERSGRFISRKSNSPRIGYPAHAEAIVTLHDSAAETEVNALVAEHLALWHPGVALAVADWLDVAAGYFNHEYTAPVERDAALAVARMILGRDA